jgi:hypothetical protein
VAVAIRDLPHGGVAFQGASERATDSGQGAGQQREPQLVGEVGGVADLFRQHRWLDH